jgi:hypothetical protein
MAIWLMVQWMAIDGTVDGVTVDGTVDGDWWYGRWRQLQ